MFNKKKQEKGSFNYDPLTHKAILKCNTCNRDKVFGFKDVRTGEFFEIAMIKNDLELESYMKEFGIDHVERKY